MEKVQSIGIIGGGVSGAVIASQLADVGIDSILFEKENSLVNGPPFCHLHAGGNLYPEIPEEQCKILLQQSINMAKLFPQSIDERPTLIAIPITEKYQVEKIENRLLVLTQYYQQLIQEDSTNKVLGSPEDYYKIYIKENILSLVNKPSVKIPKTPDEWMINALKLVDYTKLKMPLILVQEYGWNLFRLGAQVQLALQNTDLCSLKLNTSVKKIIDCRNKNLNYNWEIVSEKGNHKVKYLVNACGFKTGEIDESLSLKVNRLIEFKAAYVAKWQPIPGLIPELIFHGERGSPNGMAQLTPYSNNYYQIHGMTKDITLFENGLVKSSKDQIQPKFNNIIQKKLEKGWIVNEIIDRTEKAINYVTNYVPSFKTATVGGPPLYGAQQIPGDDPELRVGEVSFASKFYARSEIVKASSALEVASQIIKNIKKEKIFHLIKDTELNQNNLLKNITTKNIDQFAENLAISRGYPKELSELVIKK